MARCIICGRKLKDPNSIAIGMGRDCLNKGGKVSKSQVRWQHRVARTAIIRFGNGMNIGSTSYNKDNYEQHKHYLQKYKWIIKDDDITDELLLAIYNNPSYYFKEEANENK